MDPIITNALVSFGAAFSGSAISKAEGPGRALDDIMSLIGFERLHEVAEKKRAVREQNILEYKESIAQKVAQIPKENIQEPPLSIVGPALEASKYYIEEETLREMFAKIISSSMDSQKNDLVHPSFVEVIKQLNKRDAKILSSLKGEGLTVNSNYPIMQVVKRSSTPDSGQVNIFPLVVLFKGDNSFIDNSPSVNNLERLGILKTDFMSWMTNDSSYNFVRNHPVVTHVMEKNSNFELNKGILRISNFGANFINACV